MKKKILLFLFFYMSISFKTFAITRGEQEVVKAGHWIYDSLTAIMIDSGIAHFYDETPLTVQEIKILLLDIDYEKLSQAGKNNYDKIVSYFDEKKWGFGSDAFNFSLELSVNPEFQYKTNDSLDWIFDRHLRSNFIDTQFGLEISKYVFLGTDIPIAQSKSARERNDNYVNVPYDMTSIDINFPHDAYLASGILFGEKSGMNFKISTLNQSFGRSETGSVIFSENLTDAPNAVLKFFSPYVNYSADITMLGMERYMYMHKIEFRPHKKITFSLFEGALTYGNFDLRYMNPFTIFHGLAGWWDYKEKKSADGEQYDVASYLGLKINYTPVRYLRIFAHFAMNQFQMPNESDRTIPNGMAGQLGLESYIPVKDGYLHFNLEGFYATPYFMINESPNWSYVKTYRETCDDSKTFYEWIGSPYGPDSAAIKFSCGYEVRQKWAVDFSYLFLARGELSRPDFCGWGGFDYSFFSAHREENWVYPAVTKNSKYKNGSSFVSPSGVPELLNVFSFRADYYLFDFLCLSVRPGFSFAFNNKNVKDDFAVGFECSLSVKWYITKMAMKYK